MPQCCVIPKCSNRKSGHRFPRDKAFLKAWIIAIKRDKFTSSPNFRVCNDHFKESDYLMPKDSVCKNRKYSIREYKLKFVNVGSYRTL